MENTDVVLPKLSLILHNQQALNSGDLNADIRFLVLWKNSSFQQENTGHKLLIRL